MSPALTQVHDVIPAYGTVVNHNVYTMMSWLEEREGGEREGGREGREGEGGEGREGREGGGKGGRGEREGRGRGGRGRGGRGRGEALSGKVTTVYSSETVWSCKHSALV